MRKESYVEFWEVVEQAEEFRNLKTLQIPLDLIIFEEFQRKDLWVLIVEIKSIFKIAKVPIMDEFPY